MNERLEKLFARIHKQKFAITSNSGTSTLHQALYAAGVGHGDEVIIPSLTVAMCGFVIWQCGATPVYADVNEDTFLIDPKDVKRKITKKTKAIMAVDIFGQSENIKELKKISKKYNLKIISDSAQSPYSFLKGKLAGTMTDIGGYSLNCHKHINTGEGGILVTNNGKFAKKLRLIRNHAESCVDNKTPIKDLSNMLGYNFRLGEIESAIGIEQLKKLPKIVKYRQQLANVFTQNLKSLKNLNLPKIEKNNTHSYYVYPLILKDKISKKRKKIIYELRKLGVPGLMEGYINLAKLPIFQKKIAYGTKGFPWKYFNSKVSYSLNNFKNAEKLNKESFIGILLCSYDYKISDMRIIARKFNRVWEKLNLNNE